MRCGLVVFGCVLGLFCVTDVAAQNPPSASSMFCLALRLVPSAEVDPARWGRVHHPPDTVALDSTLVPGQGYRLRPEIGGSRAGRFGASWWTIGDTLDMKWNNGLTGVHLRGVFRDGSYRGTAKLITDVRVMAPPPAPPGTVMTLPAARVEGERVPCPARLQR